MGFKLNLWKCIFSLALATALLAASPLAAALVRVTLPAENTVEGPRVLLGDIAYIELVDKAGADLAASLAKVDLGEAPAAGREKILDRAYLERQLAAARLNLSEVLWSLPESIRLVGGNRQVSEASLREALEKYLSVTEPYRSGQFSLVSVNFGNLPELPPGEATFRFIPQNSSNPAYLAGSFFFTVDGRDVARVRVSAQVDILMEALVAARPLSKGQVIDESDVSLSMVPLAQAKGALTEPEQAVGQTVKSGLNPGEPIRDRSLVKTILVRRGEIVTIVAQAGGLKVSATGQARQDGALGETITVINLSSRKTISGRVIGTGQVEIPF